MRFCIRNFEALSNPEEVFVYRLEMGTGIISFAAI